MLAYKKPIPFIRLWRKHESWLSQILYTQCWRGQHMLLLKCASSLPQGKNFPFQISSICMQPWAHHSPKLAANAQFTLFSSTISVLSFKIRNAGFIVWPWTSVDHGEILSSASKNPHCSQCSGKGFIHRRAARSLPRTILQMHVLSLWLSATAQHTWPQCYFSTCIGYWGKLPTIQLSLLHFQAVCPWLPSIPSSSTLWK